MYMNYCKVYMHETSALMYQNPFLYMYQSSCTYPSVVVNTCSFVNINLCGLLYHLHVFVIGISADIKFFSAELGFCYHQLWQKG